MHDSRSSEGAHDGVQEPCAGARKAPDLAAAPAALDHVATGARRPLVREMVDLFRVESNSDRDAFDLDFVVSDQLVRVVRERVFPRLNEPGFDRAARERLKVQTHTAKPTSARGLVGVNAWRPGGPGPSARRACPAIALTWGDPGGMQQTGEACDTERENKDIEGLDGISSDVA